MQLLSFYHRPHSHRDAASQQARGCNTHHDMVFIGIGGLGLGELWLKTTSDRCSDAFSWIHLAGWRVLISSPICEYVMDKGFRFCPAELNFLSRVCSLRERLSHISSCVYVYLCVYVCVSLRHKTLKATEGDKTDDLLMITFSQRGFIS